jgi:hypothetical protein
MRRLAIVCLGLIPFLVSILYASISFLGDVPPADAANATSHIAFGIVPSPLAVQHSKATIDNFPETVTIKDGDRSYEVRYTGKILRKRAIVLIPVRIYEIAAYVEAPSEGETETLLDDLLIDGRPKLYIIRFLMPLPGKAILNDIRIALEESFGDVDMKKVENEIDHFCGQFGRGSSRGDLVHIVWLKGGKVFSGFDAPNNVEFIAEDYDFAKALWRVWAGPNSENRINLVERFSKNTQER